MSAAESPRSPRYGYWLFASIPVALILDLVGLIMAALCWCGISGCSGGGFGISRDVGQTVVCFVVIGVIMFLAVALPPWIPGWRRPVIAAGAGLAASAVAVAIVLSLH